MSELRVRLAGPSAHLGQIPAADVGRLLLGVEKAVARAASIHLRRQRVGGGRREAAVAAAAKIRLLKIEEGSVTPVLELPTRPEDKATLDFDVAHLSEEAVDRVLDELDDSQGPHRHLSRALADLSRELGIGDRYEALTFEFIHEEEPRTVVMDQSVRKRLERNAGIADQREVEKTLTGTLVEADFEKHSARLRRPQGESVTVSFPAELEDDVQNALREQASLEGTVFYAPEDLTARSIKLRVIERPRQLVAGLDPHAFWRFESFEDLARHQDAPLEPFDPNSVYDSEATPEERDAFQEAIAEYEQ